MSEIERRGSEAIVKPSEDIVASSVREFRQELQSLVEEGAKELVIDLAGIRMVDSVGLGLLIATHNSVSKAGGKLTITNASKEIHDLLRTMRLDQHFEVRSAE